MSPETQKQAKEALFSEMKNRNLATWVSESAVFVILTSSIILCNVLVLKAIQQNARLRSPSYLYIMAIAFGDLLTGISRGPLLCYYFMTGEWDLSETVCSVQGFILTAATTNTIITLGLMAIQRYLRVVRQTLHDRFFRRNTTLLTVGVSWLISIVIMAGQLTNAGFQFHPGYGFCQVLPEKVRASFFFFILLIIIPLIAIYVFYIRVYVYARSHNHAMATTGVSARELKTTKYLFVALCAFTLCFIPLMAASRYESLNAAFFTLPRSLCAFVSMLWLCSCIANPLIYIIFNQTFRREVAKVLHLEKMTRSRKIDVSSTGESRSLSFFTKSQRNKKDDQ
ncbi:melatonin receptor type 1B-B [Nematostella vectensis]|uniref:melatonin receptor type 1B-B n=1 Tax=Nematostella vectensis TaxID=45351 RepID=UPI002076EE88|nr:melatonin receptor type 1B-B [Nematostella vectensis]